MTDYQLPINQKSERLLVGIEIDLAKNNQPEKTVSDAIKRMMQSDARVRPVQHNGITIWETVQEKSNVVPELEISVPGGAYPTFGAGTNVLSSPSPRGARQAVASRPKGS